MTAISVALLQDIQILFSEEFPTSNRHIVGERCTLYYVHVHSNLIDPEHQPNIVVNNIQNDRYFWRFPFQKHVVWGQERM